MSQTVGYSPVGSTGALVDQADIVVTENKKEGSTVSNLDMQHVLDSKHKPSNSRLSITRSLGSSNRKDSSIDRLVPIMIEHTK